MDGERGLERWEARGKKQKMEKVATDIIANRLPERWPTELQIIGDESNVLINLTDYWKRKNS